jgi:hypothetical protein
MKRFSLKKTIWPASQVKILNGYAALENSMTDGTSGGLGKYERMRKLEITTVWVITNVSSVNYNFTQHIQNFWSKEPRYITMLKDPSQINADTMNNVKTWNWQIRGNNKIEYLIGNINGLPTSSTGQNIERLQSYARTKMKVRKVTNLELIWERKKTVIHLRNPQRFE